MRSRAVALASQLTFEALWVPRAPEDSTAAFTLLRVIADLLMGRVSRHCILRMSTDNLLRAGGGKVTWDSWSADFWCYASGIPVACGFALAMSHWWSSQLSAISLLVSETLLANPLRASSGARVGRGFRLLGSRRWWICFRLRDSDVVGFPMVV